ncbi:MAG: VOC family protein [Bacteroidales bacterium]
MTNLIYPCLWFNGNAREAAEFYCSAFKNSAIKSDNHTVVIVEFAGQKFMCLNGGPEFTINPSVSFYIACETEAETDRLWKVLLEGGSVLMPLDKYDWSRKYGWLQDRFGVNWQLAFGSISGIGQKFTPVLMFTGKQNGRAEEAIHFYTSIFQESAINGIMRYPKGGNDVEGAIQHAQFSLNKQLFMAMDSSLPHEYGFNEAISFVVDCENQEEIDYYWEKFTEGGEEVQCGWLKDKFGVSWQIVPTILNELMSDPSRSERVINAFLKMKKFEIDKLLNA